MSDETSSPSGADGEGTAGISDDQLPEDLRPTDDNPLAKPLTEEDDPKSAEELDVLGGKTPDESHAADDASEDDAEDDSGHDSEG